MWFTVKILFNKKTIWIRHIIFLFLLPFYIISTFSIKYFALVLAAMLIYLLTKVILEKNANSISMVKILGYENGEIASLYLMSTTFVVILSVIVGMFLATAFMSVIWKAVMISFNGWISISIPMIVYPQLFLLMMAGYFAVALLQFRKIKKIPMEDALKNIE